MARDARPGLSGCPDVSVASSGAPSEYGGRRALRPGHQQAQPVPPARAAIDEHPNAERPRGGRRALRPRERRTRGLPGTLGLTFLTAVVPGTGYLYAKRQLAGWIVLIGWAAVVGSVALYFGHDLDWAAARSRAVDLAFDPTRLRIVAAVAAVLLLVWLFVVWTSYRLVRPRERPRWHTVVGNLAVVVLLPGLRRARRTGRAVRHRARPTS